MEIIKMKNNKATSSKEKKEEVPTTPCQGPKTQLLLFLGQWFFLVLLPSFASAACDQVDHKALLSLASKVSSSPPLNWSASIDCCLWEGIVCNLDDQRIIRASLPGRGLSGVISPYITNLTYLTHLNLSRNSLSGPLPDDLFSSLHRLRVLDLSFNHLVGQLSSSSSQTTALQTVDLSSNSFNGTIPSSFIVSAVSAGTLTTFNVSYNSFTGPIPLSVFCSNGNNHTSLTILDLSFNKFTGVVPSGLGACFKLQVFRTGFNYLSGSLPDDIYDATSLQELSLPFNLLSGVINNSITRLKNLKILWLASNQFSRPIPSHIGALSRLESLLLYSNNHTGPLPPSLTNCKNLSILNLRFNNLTGDLSAFNFSTLHHLTTLDLGNNNFTGELPQSLYSCKSLTAIRLAGNQLRGQILPEIVALKSLAYLSFSSNNLTNVTGALRILMGCKNLTTLTLGKNFGFETIPDYDNVTDPDGFHNLQLLTLEGCQFKGQLPTWLANLKNLQVLDLAFNLITGSIPTWLGSLPNLFYMDLSHNLLTGGLPNMLCALPVLTSKEAGDQVERGYLELPIFVMSSNANNQKYKQLSNLPPTIYLGSNNLSGKIPIEIGQLKFIHVLDLSHNNFSGSIPDQISNLTNLERLDLSHNHLSGEIPASLKGLHFLSSFSVAYNDLQGLVPTGSQFDTFTTSSFEGNPGLCGPPTLNRSCPQRLQSLPPVYPATQRYNRKKLLVAVIFVISFGISFGIGFRIDAKKIPLVGRCRKYVFKPETTGFEIKTF
ncbi:receptor-like protein 2 [Prunus avium]|uniref:Receptor-like protein 2 n=1 Tax=Prunus avium TaxID=42229 RepID=A0A6P5T0Y2_PRUAV|nr:receptor-like protein 2 [Prunus avium]